MNESLKVQAHHLERAAYLDIRQSSMRQVVENVENTKRQYALRGRAKALGWREDQIIVVDNDQGESGASAAWREGFQRLVSEVGLGRAGIVTGLEVSRLVRNNADWHRLLEISALTAPNRDRKRLLAHVIEDATLIKRPDESCAAVEDAAGGRRAR